MSSKMSSNCVDVNSSSSSSTPVPAGTEQLCYIPCGFCSIILAVSVPCGSLFDIVTVRCGHCANLWSVNMAAALHSLSASWQQQQQQHLRSLHHQQSQTQQQLRQPHPQPLQQQHHHHQDVRLQASCAMTAANYKLDLAATAPAATASCNIKQLGTSSAGMTPGAPICNNVERAAMQLSRPPEKKQRAPSAYNQFIKEEIQRIKANNPDISHREAFSTAAKNWAHFPHIQFGLMLENNNQVRASRGL